MALCVSSLGFILIYFVPGVFAEAEIELLLCRYCNHTTAVIYQTTERWSRSLLQLNCMFLWLSMA